jgi:hypothetical protein
MSSSEGAPPPRHAHSTPSPRQGEGRGEGRNVIQPIPYDDIEHVKITRDFLAYPQRFLQHQT